MHILLQAGQLAGTCQDVGLAPQAVPKGVLSSRHHVVENAAGREDVHGAGGVLLRCLLQHLGCDPALGARDARAQTEAVPPALQLLAQPKVRDDGSDLSTAVGDGDEDVAGLQVAMNCKRRVAALPAGGATAAGPSQGVLL